MEFKYATINDLSSRELLACFRLRSDVFVVEQNCVYPDIDDKDLEAHHLLLLDSGKLMGYCRILPPGLSYKEPSVGRVVVKPSERGKNLGRALMKQSIHQTRELYQNQDIVISAQRYLEKFYTGLGFESEGEGYDEDGIPHIKMRFKTKT